MSKYEPLSAFLSRAPGRELPMRFEEIEAVLGFDLPASARSHAAWWSNSHHNPAVSAWRKAGWSTSRVDLGSQRLVFVREGSDAPRRELRISLDALGARTRQMLEEQATDGDLSAAAARLLDAEASRSKLRLLERFARKSPKLASDSTALIREDRDAR
ncbi:MAG TPA: hypothetical protein VEA79_11960 [Phenylobacterium sp.]|nr:hypothetical protein [Phenylobacterium sp.]